MEKTVYLIGAGFSAPLGLPVMSNFMSLAEDMFVADPAKFDYFRKVFDLATGLHRVKSYLHSDQLNIEEVFSILEMKRDLVGEESRDLFARFLCDVIRHYMPAWQARKYDARYVAQAHTLMWPTGPEAMQYGFFVAGLLGLELTFAANSIVCSYGKGDSLYAVITLNYDRVLEIVCENATSYLGDSCRLSFRTANEVSSGKPFDEQPALLKLHGDFMAGDVVPPTWSKGVDPSIAEEWKQAYRILREATEIRILGYSLPEADAPVRYLLKAALADGRYLKQIDVLCLDSSDGSVQSRYDEAIAFPYRFASANILKLLEKIYTKAQRDPPLQEAKPRQICRNFENSHDRFFKESS